MSVRVSLIALSVALAPPLAFADAEFDQFAVHAETSAFRVDYSPMEAFAQVFGVEEGGRFKPAYDALGSDGAEPLAQYMRYFEGIDTSRLSQDDQLAYWLNVRNLLVVQAISQERSRRGYKRKRGENGQAGPLWAEKRFEHGGVQLSIDDIERRIILANENDPNVIYGLYQGSADAPPLHAVGFRGGTVRTELARLGRDFVNSNDGLRLRRSRIEPAAIYQWYGDQVFGGDAAALRAHLASHLEDADDIARLNTVEEVRYQGFNYRVEEFVVRQRQFSNSGAGFGGGGGGGFGS